MQTLQTLVRNLALILLLATFLEMLLPNKSMRGYVQMVMGLFIISAVLAPVTTFLHTSLAMDVPAWTETTPQDLPAIAVEGQGVEVGRDAVQEQYRQILVNQIKALVLTTEGVETAEVDVQFEEGSGAGLTDQPKIAVVTIVLTSAQGEIKPIEPITIGPSPPPSNTLSLRAEEVCAKISAFMGMPKEKIIVTEG